MASFMLAFELKGARPRVDRLNSPAVDGTQSVVLIRVIQTLIPGVDRASGLWQRGTPAVVHLWRQMNRGLCPPAPDEECVLWRAAHTKNLASCSERNIGRIT